MWEPRVDASGQQDGSPGELYCLCQEYCSAGHHADQCCIAGQGDPCEMLMRAPQQLLETEDLRILTASYEEDDEMAAARDVVTADLKCLQEGLMGCNTPPPMLQLGSQPRQQPYPAHHLGVPKLEPSGAAGSSCGASSPQASCDTAAVKPQHFWGPQQSQFLPQRGDAAYSMALAHSSAGDVYAGGLPGYAMPGAVGGACAGLCCNPSLLPQGSTSLVASGADGAGGSPPPDHLTATHCGLYMSGYGSTVLLGRPAAPAAPAVAAAGLDQPFLLNAVGNLGGAPGGAAQPLPPQQKPQGGLNSFPRVQGGVQKKAAAARRVVVPDSSTGRRSGDGSSSSRDAAPAPAVSKAKKSKAASAAAPAAAAAAVRGSRTRSAGATAFSGAATSAAAAVAIAAGGSAASLIKDLQQEVEALTASKAQLRSQVRNLLDSQTDLLARVATLTTRWQQAVAENAALQRQNIQLVAAQGL